MGLVRWGWFEFGFGFCFGWVCFGWFGLFFVCFLGFVLVGVVLVCHGILVVLFFCFDLCLLFVLVGLVCCWVGCFGFGRVVGCGLVLVSWLVWLVGGWVGWVGLFWLVSEFLFVSCFFWVFLLVGCEFSCISSKNQSNPVDFWRISTKSQRTTPTCSSLKTF